MKCSDLEKEGYEVWSRSPHGERGLKFKILTSWAGLLSRSLPTRGAWIEIFTEHGYVIGLMGRSPHGERGLKWGALSLVLYTLRRSPHGERGLKSYLMVLRLHQAKSLPTRGAWIEML